MEFIYKVGVLGMHVLCMYLLYLRPTAGFYETEYMQSAASGLGVRNYLRMLLFF